jgi:hypothetical protein
MPLSESRSSSGFVLQQSSFAYLLSKVLRPNLKSSKKFIAHIFCSTKWNE